MTSRFVIITGLSGAGKSTVSGILEDLGYFCVDNLPTTLIAKFAKLCQQSDGKINKIALVIDVRERMFLKNIENSLNELTKLNIDYEIVFLEASEETLIRRFSETRRKHPLSRETLLDSIRFEKKILSPLRAKTRIIIDTSKYSIWTLKERIINLFDEKKKPQMTVTLISFGYMYGIPVESDIIFDLRFLPNPHYQKRLKALAGTAQKVKNYVLKKPATISFLNRFIKLLKFLLPYYEKEGKSYLTIGLGCTGGRHRSVVIAEHLKKVLKNHNKVVTIVHRDLTRNE